MPGTIFKNIFVVILSTLIIAAFLAVVGVFAFPNLPSDLSSFLSPKPQVVNLLAADGKIPNDLLHLGKGGGIDADTLAGMSADLFAKQADLSSSLDRITILENTVKNLPQGSGQNSTKTGLTGPVGPTGPAGATGSVGPSGSQGPAGSNGVTSLTGGGGITVSGSTGAVTLGASNIPYSSLSLITSIQNSDIAAGAAISYAKLNLSGAILGADLASNISISTSGSISGRSHIFTNSNNGNTISLSAGTTTASYNLTLPISQASGTQLLQNDGSGNLSWVNVSGGCGGCVQLVPTSTAANTVQPTVAGVIALTLKGSSTANSKVLSIFDSGAVPVEQAYFDSTGALVINKVITSNVATGSAPFIVSSTTNVANLNASFLNGNTFSNPGAIGGGTAAFGTFTTLTANTSVTDSGLTTAGIVTNSAAGLLGTLAGTTTTILHGNASGLPTFSSIMGGDLASNITISTTGNITTTGSGTISSAGLLTASNGFTLSSGALTLPANSVADAALSANVALLNAANVFSNTNSITKNGNTNDIFTVNNNSIGTSGNDLAKLSFTANLSSTGSVNGLSIAQTLGGSVAANTYTLNNLNLFATASSCPPSATCVSNGINFGNGLTNFLTGSGFTVTSAGNITAGTYNTSTLTGSALTFGTNATASVNANANNILTLNSSSTGNIQFQNLNSFITSGGALILNGNETLTGASPTISSTNASTLTISSASNQNIALNPGGTGSLTVTPGSQSSQTALTVNQTNTLTLGSGALSLFTQTVSPGSASSANFYGNISDAVGTTANLVGASIVGSAGVAEYNLGSGTLGTALGISGAVNSKTAGGTITFGSAVFAAVPTATGSITNAYGLNVQNQGAANVTNAYGVYVAGVSGASTLNYSLYINNGLSFFNSTNTSGSILQVSDTALTANNSNLDNLTFTNSNAGAGVTVNGLTLSTNAPAIPSSGTNTTNSINLSSPALTQTTAVTNTLNAINLSSPGALIQNTAAGAINWNGLNLTTPAITQTTGTVTSNAISLTGGTLTSGTANGINFTNTNFSNYITGTNYSLTSGGVETAVSSSLTGASSLTLGTASANSGAIIFKNSTNAFTATLQSGATSASYSLSLPTAQASGTQFLQNNGSGVLSWATPSVGSVALSAITSATTSNTIPNSTFAQTWNWALTGSTTAFTFGETTAATGASNNILGVNTLSGSTATALAVSAAGITTNNLAAQTLVFTENLASTGTTNGLSVTPTLSGTAAANTYTLNAFKLGNVAGSCPATATCVNNGINFGTGYTNYLTGANFKVSSGGAITAPSLTSTGNLTVTSPSTFDISINSGNLVDIASGDLATSGSIRLTTNGALSNITGYSQTSGVSAHTSATTSGNIFSITDNAFTGNNSNLANLSFTNANTAAGVTVNGLSLNSNAPGIPSSGTNTTNFLNLVSPALTQTTAVTNTLDAINLSSPGALVQNTAAGTINYNGLNLTTPAITQTTGTIAAVGLGVTLGSITTGGTQTGLTLSAGGGAGTSNGISFTGTISNFTNLISSTTFNVTSAGAVTAAAGFTSSSGNISFTSTSTTGTTTFAGSGVSNVMHLVSTQTTLPTESVVTYTAGTVTAGSTDSKGQFTVTTTAATGSVKLAFTQNYGAAPACTVSPASANTQADAGKTYVSTAVSGVTINYNVAPTANLQTWNYICIQ